MRGRVLALGALAVTLGASLVACVDLFHGTDFESACGVDAAACEAIDGNAPIDATPPSEDAGPGGPTNFCAWDGATAIANATRACTWLSACEGALGDNALGPCMIHAVLAYDCAANPNRPVLGAAHDYWDCLWQAKSCGDVDECIEPSSKAACNGSAYVACNQEAGSLVACAAGASAPTAVETCAALGQTCSSQGVATCLGSATACTATGIYCDPNGTLQLHDCDPDGGPADHGVECTSFGGGGCSAYGCGAINGTGCDATTDVTCDGGLALGCPSGMTEQIDCDAVLGQPSGSATCSATAPGRLWDVSRACTTPASCPSDLCSGTTLTTCVRGAPLPIDCTAQGFTGCEPVPYPHCSND